MTNYFEGSKTVVQGGGDRLEGCGGGDLYKNMVDINGVYESKLVLLGSIGASLTDELTDTLIYLSFLCF